MLERARGRLAIPDRDVYANLLRDTRGLRRDQASARDAWYASLPWERKEETLFELEALLKGIACFGNPRNHPGIPDAKSAVAQDFHEHLRVLRDAAARVVQLTRMLLGDKERAYTFTRYLESVLPEDAARGRLIQEQLTQDTPEEALLLLRNAFGHFLDLSEGLLRLGRISNRIYTAYHGVLVREVGRNAFFNPLMALEFRQEFDRIRSVEVLDALHGIESESAHRVVALTFLTLFRGLRYLQLVDHDAAEPGATRRAYVVLAALRSDVRTLTRYLSRRASEAMADGFESELLSISAAELMRSFDALTVEAHQLVALRGTLESIASTLRVEVRRIFDHELPSLEARIGERELGPAFVVATAGIRASLHHAIRVLCTQLRPGSTLPELGADLAARKAQSERLRREIWMFQQILRAFLAMSEASRADPDQWVSPASFQFVRDFLGHFRAIGYQLVRSHDYQRLDPFLRALDDLREVDLVEGPRLRTAVAECTALFGFLGELFGQVSARAELRDVPFDRHEAAEMLKIYLGRV
ncbi:MAG: hypothetical protein OHK0013_23150 [Sandaracinaceae bacterium]